jgi:hypothetical protein
MLPLAPVAFPLTCPAVRPRGLGGAFVAPDQATALARLENELERQVRPESTRPGRSARETRIVPPDPPLPSQRARIRTALADVQPIGQKTVRGSLTNDMIHDHDDTMASEDDELDDPGEDEAEFE